MSTISSASQPTSALRSPSEIDETETQPAVANTEQRAVRPRDTSAELQSSGYTKPQAAQPASNGYVNGLAKRFEASIPDINREAATFIKDDFKKRWDVDVDPNNTYFTTFDYNPNPGPQHAAQGAYKVSLTDALIQNRQADPYTPLQRQPWNAVGPTVHLTGSIPDTPPRPVEFPNIPPTKDPALTRTYTGIYEAGPDGTLGPDLGGYAQVPVSPADASRAIWQSNFAGNFEASAKAFWAENRDTYSGLAKAAFVKAADAQHQEGSLSSEGMDLAQRAVNVPAGKRWAALTAADLGKPGKADSSVETGLLKVHHYPSTDLMYATDKTTGRTLLHIPGNSSPIHEFAGKDGMRSWISEQARDGVKREELSKHFPASDKPDGWFHAGVDTALQGLGAWPQSHKSKDYYAGKAFEGSWSPQDYITTEASKDVFADAAKRAEGRSLADSDTLIRSNGDYQKERIASVLDNLSTALGPLAVLSPGIAAAAGAAIGAAEVGIGIDDVKHGKATGGERIAFGLLNAVPAALHGAGAAIAAGGAEEIAASASGTAGKSVGNSLVGPVKAAEGKVTAAPAEAGIVGPEETITGHVHEDPDLTNLGANTSSLSSAKVAPSKSPTPKQVLKDIVSQAEYDRQPVDKVTEQDRVTIGKSQEDLLLTSNADELDLVKKYVDKDPGNYREALRMGHASPEVDEFRQQFSELKDYSGRSYRAVVIRDYAARRLENGKGVTFGDKSLQSASITQRNVYRWLDDGWSESSALPKSSQKAVFVFDKDIPQKNMATAQLPDQVAIPPNTPLTAAATLRDPSTDVLYVYFKKAKSDPLMSIDVRDGQPYI